MSSTRFFEVFMPALAQAGRYALEIRDRIESRPEKSGDAWTSVVTDADLGVQHYLEAVALAWLLSHPAGLLPILGSQNPVRIRAAAAAYDVTLTRRDWYAVLEASPGAPMP